MPASPHPLISAPSTAVDEQPVPFPSPQTFDFIPPLHALVLRLLSSTSTSSAAAAPVTSQSTIEVEASAAGATASQPETQSQTQTQTQIQIQTQTQTEAGSQSQTQRLSQSQQPKSSVHSASLQHQQAQQLGLSLDSSAHSSSLPPLEAKDLFTAASAIRIRIQKARTVVESLPDVQRTVAEQQQEIDELQNRIASLRAVLVDFGKRSSISHVGARADADGDGEGDKMDVDT